MPEINEYQELVDFAMPWARRCGDVEGFARECAREVARTGEPAFFMETIKRPDAPKRFPCALSLWAYDEAKNQTYVLADMAIDRPEYKDNPHGFRGDHLVVALLQLAQNKARELVPEGVDILTSRSAWSSLIHGPGYRERKEQRHMERLIPANAASPAPRARSRL